jgi:hypothetical protein
VLGAACFELREETATRSVVEQIWDTVGTINLRTLHIRYMDDESIPTSLVFERGLAFRSLNLEHLRIDLDSDWPDKLSPFLPMSLLASKGTRPLERLRTLQVNFISPSLWEYLSRLGVKLVGATIQSEVKDSFLPHVLDVMRGPHLQHFDHQCELSSTNPLIHTSLFERPRRSIALDFGFKETRIPPGSMARMEKLVLRSCKESTFAQIFSLSLELPLRNLRDLRLDRFKLADAVVAQAIRSVAGSLQSFELVTWLVPADRSVEQTVSAIGSESRLERLRLVDAAGISNAMLEPILIGIPPGQPPLCPCICKVFLWSSLEDNSNEYMARLRDSIRQRFPYDGGVNGEPVCQPAAI